MITSGGGPSIGVARIEQIGRRKTTIVVLEDRTPGPLDVITNPYQIIVTPSLGRSIVFRHIDSDRRLCQYHEDCLEDSLCSRGDATCQSPVTGQCFPHPPGSGCPQVSMPVCGCDGITYSNSCFLDLEGAIFKHLGECP